MPHAPQKPAPTAQALGSAQPENPGESWQAPKLSPPREILGMGPQQRLGLGMETWTGCPLLPK